MKGRSRNRIERGRGKRQVFVGASVPGSMAKRVNAAVKILGFSNRANLLRAAIEAAVEEFKH